MLSLLERPSQEQVIYNILYINMPAKGNISFSSVQMIFYVLYKTKENKIGGGGNDNTSLENLTVECVNLRNKQMLLPAQRTVILPVQSLLI